MEMQRIWGKRGQLAKLLKAKEGTLALERAKPDPMERQEEYMQVLGKCGGSVGKVWGLLVYAYPVLSLTLLLAPSTRPFPTLVPASMSSFLMSKHHHSSSQDLLLPALPCYPLPCLHAPSPALLSSALPSCSLPRPPMPSNPLLPRRPARSSASTPTISRSWE